MSRLLLFIVLYLRYLLLKGKVLIVESMVALEFGSG